MPADRPATTPAQGALLAALDRYFGITDSLHGNGCEHGFKPAKACPNADCEARAAQEAWEALSHAG